MKAPLLNTLASGCKKAGGLQVATTAEALCSHLDQIRDVTPSANGCEECLKMGDTWMHLRLCESCGHVGCCDDSKNKHATKHYRATRHPIIKSFEPGEEWGWCYVDELFFESL
jgi:uncharacterized UBP type Zn finger protein